MSDAAAIPSWNVFVFMGVPFVSMVESGIKIIARLRTPSFSQEAA